jgi:hypothetical protein
MRARALRAGRKPWKWSELQPLTVDGFRSRPWLLSAYRYEDDGVVADVLARLAGVL